MVDLSTALLVRLPLFCVIASTWVTQLVEDAAQRPHISGLAIPPLPGFRGRSQAEAKLNSSAEFIK
jgi:hypothetical protein